MGLHKIKILFIICIMNTMISKQDVGIIRPSELQDWLTSHGIITVTTEECAHLLGVPINEVPQRLVRLRSKGELVSGARGLWIAVPSEYRQMGAPEPMRYIHNLMAFYDNEYCVGWLSAASIHGASHQAPQVFQVAVCKTIRNRRIGRSELQFYHRSYVPFVSKKRTTLVSGSAYVCSVGATMLMVAAEPANCGGIDNAATIICELADNQTDYMREVLMDAHLFPKAAVHRLGWILDYLAKGSDLDELSDYCALSSEPTMLSQGGSRKGSINKKWNVIENRRIEIDI